MTKTVLITGASGKIGRHAALAFSKAGWKIRKFNRKSDELTKAAMGVDVIVNGFNPPAYRNWSTEIPRITTEVIEAAKASGASVIVPGNVYNFGKTPGTWGPHTPQNATTRKGKIRIEMEAQYRYAAAQGVQTIILRGGDFIDTEPSDTLMSLVILGKLNKGTITALGPVDCERAFCYLPDWARAAVALAENAPTLERFVDVPLPSESFTPQELRDALEVVLGRKLTLKQFPWWALYAAAPFWKLANELIEMRYLSEVPHHLSGDRLKELLPDFIPSPRSHVLSAEVPKTLLGTTHLAA